jgi:hypothetical protein
MGKSLMTLNIMTGELTNETKSLREQFDAMTEEQVADLILDVGEELKRQIDLYALKQDPNYKTPMERYLESQDKPFIPVHIPLYETDWAKVDRNYKRGLQRVEQHRIDMMDPWDYQLELDCSFMYEMDKIFGIEHRILIEETKLPMPKGWM